MCVRTTLEVLPMAEAPSGPSMGCEPIPNFLFVTTLTPSSALVRRCSPERFLARALSALRCPSSTTLLGTVLMPKRRAKARSES
eukprot:CAMPEP_0117485394 /NCGR_PEP_ID=MMETSP0784-20121206/14946_1 /TAXON_ID=39447 /ORGANISM="" /LENGTH=83 /DNA_ID=CAMNT_0005279987 /DNA_START=135 /DNA_END=382 /DNA_ORIENTATION=+